MIPEVGEDTLAGRNVNSIALQVPKFALALDGSTTDNSALAADLNGLALNAGVGSVSPGDVPALAGKARAEVGIVARPFLAMI